MGNVYAVVVACFNDTPVKPGCVTVLVIHVKASVSVVNVRATSMLKVPSVFA